MSIGSIVNLSGYLQSVLSSAFQGAGSSNSPVVNTSASQTSSTGQADNSQLSPFAQLMSTLQQLQQSNPAEYQQVAGQVAANLQSAAQTAQTNGNTTAANHLNQLSTDFATASTSGQLPNIADLAQAVGGHHHHHGGHHAKAAGSATDTDGSSGTGSTTTPATQNQTLSQLLSTLATNAGQDSALNPIAIITNTLTSAGI
jgi:hypothetical protein